MWSRIAAVAAVAEKVADSVLWSLVHHENRPAAGHPCRADQHLVELWPRMRAARELLPGIVPELLGPIDLASWIARR